MTHKNVGWKSVRIVIDPEAVQIYFMRRTNYNYICFSLTIHGCYKGNSFIRDLLENYHFCQSAFG